MGQSLFSCSRQKQIYPISHIHTDKRYNSLHISSHIIWRHIHMINITTAYMNHTNEHRQTHNPLLSRQLLTILSRLI